MQSDSQTPSATPQPTTPQPEPEIHDVPRVGMIWAQTVDGVIGHDGDMPWHIPEDLRHFKSETTGYPVIMGRRTWESFPAKFRPLPNRQNIIVSRSLEPANAADEAVRDESVIVVNNFPAALDTAMSAVTQTGNEQLIWVIGGGTLYEQALDVASVVSQTLIDAELDGDTWAPELDDSWELVSSDPAEGWHTSTSGVRYRFQRWERSPQ